MSAITDELKRLGKLTPDQIAADFRERGIKGQRAICGYCPVANDLNALGYFGAIVGPSNIYWHDNGSSESLATPESVRSFMYRLDIGKYPDLVEQ